MDKIKDCKELQDPAEVAKILEEAQAWPDPKAVEKDLKTIQDALKKLYDTVGKDMEKMAGKQPKDLKFEELDETLAKYKKWPDEHKANIKAPLDKLEAKRDELVKEAKEVFGLMVNIEVFRTSYPLVYRVSWLMKKKKCFL